MISNQGIPMRVFGPRSSAAQVEGAGFTVRADAARQMVDLFKSNFAARKTGPVQMLVESPDMPASVVNVSRYYGKAAAAHVLRAAPAGDVPAMAAIMLLLPGLDPDADEEAIRAVETSRDKAGNALPLPPTVYQSLRADVRPLLAMIFFNEQAVTDTSLRLLGVTLGEAFFATLRNATPSDNLP